MAASSSSLVCSPCSSSSASAISSAPHHRRAQTVRARRPRSKSATSRDLLSPSNASKPCSFCPLSPSSTSKLGAFCIFSPIDSRFCNNSPSSTSKFCSFCTLSRFDSPNCNNTATRNASSAAPSSPRLRKHPNQAGIDVRSGGRSPASSESIPVNCICCSATLSFHRPFPSGGRKCGGIPLREDNSGSCSGTPRTGGGGGGDSAITSRSFSLQNLSNLVPFQSAGRQRSVKVVGVMKAGTSVAPPIVKPSSRLSPGDPLGDDYVDDDPTKTGPERRAGILLHPTSLPGSYGIGELGDEALHFLDWLKGAGCTVWQVLPLVPPGRKSGEDGSPYAGEDANCGNTLLISLEELVKWGLLEKSDLPRRLPVNRVDYDAVAKVKDPLILKAAQKLLATDGGLRVELEKFRKNPNVSVWLEEAALFAAIDHSIDTQFWWKWPAPLRDRDPKALENFRKEHKQFIDEFVAQQFLFQRQWQAVHKYAREQGIRIIGDMPIYVGGHSADVWAHRGSFMLDEKTGVPTFVSGVPPDAFSATGQLWGSPLYNWKAMGKDNYSWWAMRMKRAYDLYDEFRIDHFRGLAGYWAVKADEETALNGTWKVGPRLAFFDAIQKAVGKIDIIAEDLGVITSDVVELRRAIKAPGMAVLQFAFGSDPQNPHLPHNHEIEQVVYPGTHDNDTVKGWWVKLPEDEKESVRDYLRLKGNEESISWDFIKATFSSVARTAIIPMQDVLSLDNSARMNIPAVQAGNWGWRVGESGVFTKLDKERDQLRALLKYYNRMPRRIYCPI